MIDRKNELENGLHEAEKSPRKLMAIDFPELIIKTICSLRSGFTREDFGNKLRSVSGKDIGKDSKFIQMNLYTATMLHLLTAFQKSEGKAYRLSHLGELLCVAFRENNKEMLSSVLLQAVNSHEKFKTDFEILLGMLYKAKASGRPLNEDEVRDKFGPETTRTLMSFGRLSGMIASQGKMLWLVDSEKKRNITLNDFKSALFECYRRHTRSAGMSTPRRRYIEIARLRQSVLAELGLTERTEFDDLLNRLLDEPAPDDGIRLYGAASPLLPDSSDPSFEDKLFRRKGKLYFYITVPLL